MSNAFRRQPPSAAHHARTAAPQDENDEVKTAYIEFIDKLMHRMRMDSIERMLEAALKETDKSE